LNNYHIQSGTLNTNTNNLEYFQAASGQNITSRCNGLNPVWEMGLKEHLRGCAGDRATEKVEFSI
jgi:hypothetical protein